MVTAHIVIWLTFFLSLWCITKINDGGRLHQILWCIFEVSKIGVVLSIFALIFKLVATLAGF